MKFNRKANAQWLGSGKEGKGSLTTASAVLDKTQYSFKTRFEDGKGTNPEELVGAAHAGCFAMQLSFLLGEAGFTPDTLDVEATVSFEDGSVTTITLDLKGTVPGITTDKFNEVAEKAKEVCPISKLMKADIVLNVSLNK
ncbi:MAG: osmotically inducible protein OsmC [Psychroserpens sp.]|jgi:osmotically inducible protein OsmC